MQFAGVNVYRDVITGVLLRLLVDDPKAIVAMAQVSSVCRKWTMSSKAARLAGFALLKSLPRHEANRIRKKWHDTWALLSAFNRGCLFLEDMYRKENLVVHEVMKLIHPEEYISCKQVVICMLYVDKLSMKQDKVELYCSEVKQGTYRLVETQCSSIRFTLSDIELRKMLCHGRWSATCDCGATSAFKAPSSLQYLFWRRMVHRKTNYVDEKVDWVDFVWK